MNRTGLMIVCAGLVAIAFGCLPEERVVWSPDGQRAAVRAADGLYICDVTGRLSQRVLDRVGPVAWFPDSCRLICVEGVEVKTWDDLAREWPVPDQKKWTAMAHDLRTRILHFEGDWEDFDYRIGKDVSGAKLIALLMYIRDEHSEGMPEKISKRWKDLQDLTITVHTLNIYSLMGDSAKLNLSLFATIEAIKSIRLSPHADHVAFVVDAGEGSGTSLYVAPTDASAGPRLVEQHVGAYPDWSANGRYLAYARASMPNPLMDENAVGLGAVAWRKVCNESGLLLEEFSDTEDLAGVLFHDTMRVRCLRDGRILFLAQDVQLPCAAGDMPQHFTLFEVSPGQRPTVARAITRQADEEVSDTMGFFEISPDEKRVVLPVENGTIVMYNLGTGQVTTVSSEEDVNGKVRMLPVWRSDSELCFAAPGEGGKRMEVVLWSKGRTRPLSASWPESAVTGFLVDPEPDPETVEAAQKVLTPVEESAE